MTDYDGRFRYACEPAATIIRALGGVRRTAAALGLSPEAVSQWNRPASRRGTGGYVPPRHWPAVLKAGHGSQIISRDLLRQGRREVLDVASASRAKGDRFERQVVADLRGAGLEARRVPLSGAAADYPGDVEVVLPTGRWLIQCKHTESHAAGGRQSVARLLGQVTVARVRAAGVELVAMRRAVFLDLLHGKLPRVVNMPAISVPGRMIVGHLEGHDALIFRRTHTTEWMAIVRLERWT